MPRTRAAQLLRLGAAALVVAGASATFAAPAHAATRAQTFTIQRGLQDPNSYVHPSGGNVVGSMVDVGGSAADTWQTNGSGNLYPAGNGANILGPTNLSTPGSTAQLNPGANYPNPEHQFALYNASGTAIPIPPNGSPGVTGYICTTANITNYNDKACLVTSGGSYSTTFTTFANAKSGNTGYNQFVVTPIPASLDFVPSQPSVPTLAPGATGTLPVKLTNNGPDDDNGNIGVPMTFTAPNNTTFTSNVVQRSDGQSLTCTLSAGNTVLTCPTDYFQSKMTAGSSLTYNLSIQASPSAPPGTTQGGGQATSGTVTTVNGWRGSDPTTSNNTAALSVNISGTAQTPAIDPAVGGTTVGAMAIVGGIVLRRRRTNSV